MQYDLYLNDTHVGGISAIGLAEQGLGGGIQVSLPTPWDQGRVHSRRADMRGRPVPGQCLDLASCEMDIASVSRHSARTKKPQF